MGQVLSHEMPIVLMCMEMLSLPMNVKLSPPLQGVGPVTLPAQQTVWCLTGHPGPNAHTLAGKAMELKRELVNLLPLA